LRNTLHKIYKQINQSVIFHFQNSIARYRTKPAETACSIASFSTKFWRSFQTLFGII